MDNTIIPVPLDLPDVRILSTEQARTGAWLVRIESTLTSTTCTRCGRETSDVHGLDDPIRLRHLPIFDAPVVLELRPKRFRCRACPGGPTTTQRCAWYSPRSRSTKAFERWALRCLIDSTLAETARKLATTEEVLEGILDRHLKRKVDWRRYGRISMLGIDEIARRKGRGDFIVLVTTILDGQVEVLAVLADRRKATLVAFLASIPKRMRARIAEVCIDMYVSYERAVKAQMPGARVTVDRFHVARAYGGAADAVRKRERRRLEKELSKARYEEAGAGVMWPFRKHWEDLDDAEFAKLERAFTASPEMERAYTLREELREIFDRRLTKRGAKVAIRAWCKRVEASGLREFDAFLGTIRTWLDQITNYFVERHTSGFVEGFNTRVKVLKRRCYGIYDLGRLFQRLTLDVRGHAMFAPP